MSPEKIGRYEITGELGRGAMGLVYKALDPNIGRTVALKTMRLDVSGVEEEDMLRRFKHEARLAGVMNHPNIVTIYDAGEEQSVFYIAMEYVDGDTLQTVLHEQRVLPVKRMIEVSRQICAGLDYAHAHGVIHRDIKPGNIMLGPDGTAKIMDFGIAKSTAGMTSAGQVLGTPTYMSPEQVKGRQLDGRTDLFSWGVVLYEMVTGEKPFTGENLTTIIYKIIHEDPIPPRELDVSIHPGLSHIVTKSLAKNPDERYQTGAELVADLESYKSIGGDLEGTRIIAAVTSHTVSMPAAASPKMPSQAVPTPAIGEPAPAMQPIAIGNGGAAAVMAPAAGAAEPAAPRAPQAAPVISAASLDSTVSARPKAPAVPAVSIKTSRNKAIAVGAALAVTFVGGYVALRNRPAEKLPAVQSKVAAQQQAPATGTATASNVVTAPIQSKKHPVQSLAANSVAQQAPGQTQKPSPEKIADDEVKKLAQASAPPIVKPVVPEAKFGSVRISSEPAGAKVTIGGAVSAEWVTPFNMAKLEPGDYDVTFSKPGFVPQTVNIKVTAGHPSVAAVKLVMAGAVVNVTSNPPGANILVDGKVTAKVTPAQINVDPGEHRILVKKPGFREENTAISLKDGQSYSYAPTLQAKQAGSENPFQRIGRFFGGKSMPEGKGVVNIKTRPAGAHMLHNGQSSTMTTPARVPMVPGSYDITLQLEGYQPVQKHFDIQKGKVTELSVDLVPVKK